MLSFLRIRNFALVEDLEIEFGAGFNAITGETGAGKSLLIGALNLLLGERADKTSVRTGAREAVVEAVFMLPDGVVEPILADAGLEPGEDHSLLLRRIVPREGAGRNLVNGGTTTLAVLKRLGECLVDLHGPHEHQSLFQEGPRIAMLDAFGGSGQDRERYASEFLKHRELLARRQKLSGLDDDMPARMEMLEFQVRELDEAKLDEAEESSLASELDSVANAQRIRELGGSLDDLLMGDEGSVFGALSDAQRMLTELERIYPVAAEWNEELRALATRIKEVDLQIHSSVESVDDDAERLNALENRMALYFRLKRKYKASVPELIQRLDEGLKQIEAWHGRDEMLRQLDHELETAWNNLTELGAKLSARRRRAAVEMARSITTQLADLGLAKGEFRVTVESAPPRLNGVDRVEYEFTPNQGEPTAPLQAIASSGEISRVMLAVKAVLAEFDRVPILVFDEIDANLGGEAGHAVGRKLADLAQHHQVIGITHLAQVAACARDHFAVSKVEHGGRTRTGVQRLADNQQRGLELVRMLGGNHAGATALRLAEAMLRQGAESGASQTRKKTPQLKQNKGG